MRGRVETDEFAFVRASAREGVGIAFSPIGMVASLVESGELERVLPRYALRVARRSAAYRVAEPGVRACRGEAASRRPRGSAGTDAGVGTDPRASASRARFPRSRSRGTLACRGSAQARRRSLRLRTKPPAVRRHGSASARRRPRTDSLKRADERGPRGRGCNLGVSSRIIRRVARFASFVPIRKRDARVTKEKPPTTLELSGVELEREKGFEPSTLALARRCSTTELFPQGQRGGAL